MVDSMNLVFIISERFVFVWSHSGCKVEILLKNYAF